MNIEEKKLSHPPIVEAIIDIDCDMPPEFEVGAQIERAQGLFSGDYPQFKKRYLHSQEFEGKIGESPKLKSSNVNVQSLLFQKKEEDQLIQVRKNGFSFNRLTPYTSLDEYLPEIERTWTLFVDQFSPRLVRRIGLRYINRILLPLESGGLELDDYLKVGPKLPKDSSLQFAEFMHQQKLVEQGTGNAANVVLSTQPTENEKLPLIFDIGTTKDVSFEPSGWAEVKTTIESLRELKNHIFFDSLMEKCKCLFN
jgi:uncharacterized protein (TIGR04255 family)